MELNGAHCSPPGRSEARESDKNTRGAGDGNTQSGFGILFLDVSFGRNLTGLGHQALDPGSPCSNKSPPGHRARKGKWGLGCSDHPSSYCSMGWALLHCLSYAPPLPAPSSSLSLLSITSHILPCILLPVLLPPFHPLLYPRLVSAP